MNQCTTRYLSFYYKYILLRTNESCHVAQYIYDLHKVQQGGRYTIHVTGDEEMKHFVEHKEFVCKQIMEYSMYIYSYA